MHAWKIGCLAALIGGLGAWPAPAQPGSEKPERVTLHGRKGRHRFRVEMVIGPFRAKKHRAFIKRFTEKDEDGYDDERKMPYIDGKPESQKEGRRSWYGTDGGLPTCEIYSFFVSLDGKRRAVPNRLWQDCYEPNIGQSLHARLSRGGKQLDVGMEASDGAGSYRVVWHLRANRQDSRRISFSEEPWEFNP